jgi:hypothetical protein
LPFSINFIIIIIISSSIIIIISIRWHRLDVHLFSRVTLASRQRHSSSG